MELPHAIAGLHDRLLQQWRDRLRDHARAVAFFRFLWRRFLDDRLFEAAGALAYTTVFALVPLSMVVFGVLSAFPKFSGWSNGLVAYIFQNFVPASAIALEDKLHIFLDRTAELTIVGVIALLASLLIALTNIEAIFNRIWRVKTARPVLSRLLVYWTVFTLGALVAATSLALSVRFFALSIFSTAPGQVLETVLLKLAPIVLELAAFAAVFRLVPHRSIKWRHALAGALLSVLLFETLKWGLGLYLGTFNSYQKIYGSLAAAPIFLLWIYLGWVSILLGASVAASLSAFRYQPASMRLPEGYEMYGLLRLLGRFAMQRRDGKGLHSDEIHRLEPLLTDALIQEFLGQLSTIGLVVRAESGEWLLARDLEGLSMADLYEACQLRIPIAEAHLPCREDALGTAAIAELDEVRLPLRELLRRRVSDVYRDLPKDPR
jgi:membrane protein